MGGPGSGIKGHRTPRKLSRRSGYRTKAARKTALLRWRKAVESRKSRTVIRKSGRTIHPKGSALNALRGKLVKRPTSEERKFIDLQLKTQKPRRPPRRKKWSGAL